MKIKMHQTHHLMINPGALKHRYKSPQRYFYKLECLGGNDGGLIQQAKKPTVKKITSGIDIKV